MRRISAVTLLVGLVGLVACGAPPPAPKGPSAAPGDASSSAVAPAVAPTASEPPLAPTDPRTVRCGVDDVPRSVLGANGPRDEELGAQGGRLAKIMVAPPSKKPRPPGITAVALATSRYEALFQSATRGGQPLEAWQRTILEGKKFDLTSCAAKTGAAKGGVSVQLRVASSGVPLDATARATELDETLTRCVTELGCRISFPPSPETGVFDVRVAVTETPPVFKGSASSSTSSEGEWKEGWQPHIDKIEQTLRPLIQACAQQFPPASSMNFAMRYAVDAAGAAVPIDMPLAGAAAALHDCLKPRYPAALGTLPLPFRKKTMRSVVVVSVSAVP